MLSFYALFVQCSSWDPHSYSHAVATVVRDAQVTFLDLLIFKGTEAVLDVGCGDGLLAAYVAKKVPQGHVLGSDYSESMITYAKSTYPHEKNISFVQEDASAIGYTHQFDVVMSFMCLHWIADQQHVISRIARALKPEGQFVLMISRNAQHPFFKSVMNTVQSKKWAHFYKDIATLPWFCQEQETLREMLEGAGFKIINLIQNSCTIMHKDKPTMITWAESWMGGISYVNQLPSSLWPNLIDDIITKYIELMPADEQGNIHYEMPYIMVVAQKT